MRRLALLVVTTLALAPAVAAQTCAGVLTLVFADPDTGAPVDARTLGARGTVATGRLTAGSHPTLDEVRARRLLRPSATVRPAADGKPPGSRLYVSGPALAFRPRCGTEMLRLALAYRGAKTVVDLYRIPAHIALRLDAPVRLRPGRTVIDFGQDRGTPGADGVHVYATQRVATGT